MTPPMFRHTRPLARALGAAGRSLHRLGTARQAAILPMTAILMVPVMAAVGLAVDLSRGHLVESRMGRALDAAGLAAGRIYFDEGMQADAKAYFALNFPDGTLGAVVDPLRVEVRQDRLLLTATARLPTTFMRLLGRPTLTVSTRAVVHREARGMELVLVMDNTGSMDSGGKITAMKAGARDLVEILYEGRETVPNFWVGLVPYSASVNIGAGQTAWLSGHDSGLFPDTAPWKGCVEARSPRTEQGEDWTATDRSDEPPVPATPVTATRMGPDGVARTVTTTAADNSRFRPYFWESAPDNDWRGLDVDERQSAKNSGRGPNLGCGPAITPLQPSRASALAAIDQMQPWFRGGTMTNVGLAWGWRVLSPRWRGLWPGTPPDRPGDYGDRLVDKVAVILTDGENQFFNDDYTSWGRRSWGRIGTTTSSTANDQLDTRMAEICTAMKDEGIILYTITFRVSDSGTRNLFASCASSPAHYFDSPSNEQLRETFRQIAGSLSNLRLAQ